MEDWSISLGNTLLASIVCLIWYVVGLWEEKDVKVSEEATSLTSAEKKVRSVDKEENFNNGSSGHLFAEGGEGHLYMLPEEGRHQLIAEQSKRRQEEIQQSTMQLQEEKAPIQTQKEKKKTMTKSLEVKQQEGLIAEQSKRRQEEIQSTMQLQEEKAPIQNQKEEKQTMTKSLDVLKQQGPTTFQWPQNASLLESARPTTSTVLSSALEDKLKDLGIFRAGRADGSNCQKVDGAARRCGLELTKKQVRVSFDTFMAKSRPGLESDEEVKEMSPKPKRKGNSKRNNNVKEKKAVEPATSRYEKKENRTMIRTGGWSNPAWKMVQPQPSQVLVRAF